MSKNSKVDLFDNLFGNPNNLFGLNPKCLYQQIQQRKVNEYNFYNKVMETYNKLSDIEDHSSRYFLKNGRTRNNFIDIAKNSKNFFKDALISHMTKRDLPYVLRMEDRNSMSQSIEARVPFLDHEMVEYIYNIKTRYFMNKGENKHILRDCFKLFFSKEVASRKDKSARPGDNSVFIFNDFYESFIELLNLDLSNDHFESKKIKLQLERDKNNKSYVNSNFYFRVFNYLVWLDNNTSLI